MNLYDRCADDMAMLDFIQDKMDGNDCDSLKSHMLTCQSCAQRYSDSIASFELKSHPHKPDDDLAEHVLKVKSQVKSAEIGRRVIFSEHLWLFACALFLLASFYFRDYYKQFLVASLITGGKWLLESRQAKSNITLISDSAANDGTRLKESGSSSRSRSKK